MTYTYFDVETIPDQSPDALERAMQSVKVPGNYKDPNTIEKYKQEKAQEALDKTALDGFKGHVACISWLHADGWVESASVRTLDDEALAIRDFFKSLKGHKLVGHNIVDFDLVFLTKRALVLGVPLPNDFAWPRNPKPWDNAIFDTMTQFGKEWVSLDALCGYMGIDGKDDVDGSMVSGMWDMGLHDAIQRYCEADVMRVKQVHERFMSVGW